MITKNTESLVLPGKNLIFFSEEMETQIEIAPHRCLSILAKLLLLAELLTPQEKEVDTQRHENGLSWEKENDVEDTAVKIPGQIRSLTNSYHS
ncbi:hypothetical protein DAPPUDRAFT_233559 [Daphnia pulex]|uniref:Uncharacterized protein n=1 Tax=Daphnia pulex TaxID=6669 RepID=E9FV46_DAPPU|nr:hypothetical protein DAPPUDRAFT_233559 [Daphnia pulex]|eukprot:EFX89172.1 hypothetical protein DAPPUDRAFT_233559 [Daphnia pulex]